MHRESTHFCVAEKRPAIKCRIEFGAIYTHTFDQVNTLIKTTFNSLHCCKTVWSMSDVGKLNLMTLRFHT